MSLLTSSFSTPIKSKLTGAVDWSAVQLKNDVLRQRIEQEMKGYFLGPMPVEDFLDTFMPERATPPCPHADFSQMASQTSEKGMYEAFVSSHFSWIEH
jgi:hypothetical protein